MSVRDEHAITRGDRIVGYLGPFASSFTLAWLASHRDRLRTLILGGKRWSVLFIWDREGTRSVGRSDEDVAAIKQLVYGSDRPARKEQPDA